jgi:hypothetical protein
LVTDAARIGIDARTIVAGRTWAATFVWAREMGGGANARMATIVIGHTLVIPANRIISSR